MAEDKLMDVVLKKYTQFSSNQYAKTLFAKDGKRIEQLRKVFNIPATGKALVEMDIAVVESLKDKLDDYIDNYGTANVRPFSKKYAQDIRSHVNCWIRFYHENHPEMEQIVEIIRISCAVSFLSFGKLYKIQGVVKEIVYDAEQAETPNRFVFVPEQNFSLTEAESENQLAVFMEHDRKRILKQKDARILSYRKQLTFQLAARTKLPKLATGKITVFLMKSDDSNCEIMSDLDEMPGFDDLSIIEYGVRQ